MHKVRSALLALAVVGLGSVPAGSQARELPAPREVTVRVAPSGVKAPDALRSARYRLTLQAPRRVPALLQLVKPDRGYTRAEFRADVRRRGGVSDRRIMSHLRFFGGAELRAGQTGALWETLYAGRYWLMGVAARPGGQSIHTIRVHGTPSPRSFPRVSAEATGTESGLRLSRTAPESGRMLIRNANNDVEALTLVPLTEGTTYADFIHWLRRPHGRMPLRLRGIRSTALLSPDAGYVLRYRLRPGDYVVTSLGELQAAGPAAGPRQFFHPLTVEAASSARAARARSPRLTEGFQRTPAATRHLGRWLADDPRNVASPLAHALVARMLGRQ